MGKNPDNVKHKERLRKNVEYLSQLKSLKRADIMRSLLLQIGTNHNGVLSNGRATPDEVAIAMLGINKLMQGLVDEFQKALKLSSEADAKWREEILETSKRRLKLERTEEKRRRRKELKEQKTQQRNRIEWMKHNNPDDDKNTEKDNVLEDGAYSVITGEGFCRTTKSDDIVLHVQKSDKPKQSKKPTKTEQLEKKNMEDEKKNTSKVNSIKAVSKNVESGIDKNLRTMEAINKRRNSEYDYKSKEPKEDVKARPTHVIDPFFITESGQPYLSTAVVVSDDNNDTDDEQVEQSRRKSVSREQEHKNTRRINNHNFSNFVKNQRTVQSNKKIKFGEDGRAEEPTVPEAVKDGEGMHPSWLAKQKLKPKIVAFKGSKITFDDD